MATKGLRFGRRDMKREDKDGETGEEGAETSAYGRRGTLESERACVDLSLPFIAVCGMSVDTPGCSGASRAVASSDDGLMTWGYHI